MTDKIILTAAQHQRFAETGADKSAATLVYDRATVLYHNTLNSIVKTEMALWEELAEIHMLNLVNESYQLRMDPLERRYVIEAKDKD